MMKKDLLETRVSFGTDIKQPSLLETRRVGEVLDEIRFGKWRDDVKKVRNLRGWAQRIAKNALPYFTPAGEFSYRAKDGLIRYSGIVVIDLDDLPRRRVDKALQTAIIDRHCFAAFRSPRGNGLKLLFRVPRRFGSVHSEIHRQVARHVRRTYGVKPDAGNDVSRACFVSWDDGAWIYGRALELPIREPSTFQATKTTRRKRSVDCIELEVPADFEKLIGRRRPGDWEFETEGFQCGPSVWKTDDHSFTNMALLTLARKVSTAIRKLPSKPKEKEAERLLAVAFRGWLKKARYRKVRWSAKTYWKEHFKMFSKQMRSTHPEKNASTWTRWRQHVDFPRDGSSRDKILFAIRKHCEERATNRFYLGMRDAGRIAGISHVHAGKHLQRLRAEGRIAYNPGSLRNRGGRRKAQKWILVG